MKAESLAAVGRLPLPDDNVAIATRYLAADTVIIDGERRFVLSHDVLVGHRFATQPIAAHTPLRSWGLPFGLAIDDIAAGTYVCNQAMIDALRGRDLRGLTVAGDLTIALPDRPNFIDHIEPFHLDAGTFEGAAAFAPVRDDRTFLGYRREAGRGVGTRNHLVVLATTSRANAVVRRIVERLARRAPPQATFDGAVAIEHTEGGGHGRPNNLDLVLRTLAGFMVHPNVGAVLALDDGVGYVTNEALRRLMVERGYPHQAVPCAFLTLTGAFEDDVAQGERVAARWLDTLRAARRTPEPVAHLTLALQCGGSDAFSGISGNPLAAWVAREIIRRGGAANLAETDELIGAEAYLLQRVRDVPTAERFLAAVARFEERAGWHGASAAGNPTGGNLLRGLYNIALKSIGAALKRHPDVRLDHVIGYGERHTLPGFAFMDSPGNDLESIAGQVASGCNLITFVTGNGSITNFPFVPTIKIVTTSERYELLADEMDVDAGAYLSGTPLDDLGARTFDLVLDVASGARSAGERAGHAQVQLWRDWPQRDASALARLAAEPAPAGASIPLVPLTGASRLRLPEPCPAAAGGVALILPTSLCAGQVALAIARRLEARGLGRGQGVRRFLALVHTEGCGVSSGASEELYVRTLLGYLVHPLVRHALLLEHGCEKTHNDFLRGRLVAAGIDPGRVGWASIQRDGGVARAGEHVERWFERAIAAAAEPALRSVGVGDLRVAIAGSAPPPPAAARGLAAITRAIVEASGTVVVAANAGVLAIEAFRALTLGPRPVGPTLAYGERPRLPGLHVMATPNEHWIETLTGLGATGVELIVSVITGPPQSVHPLVPVLQVGVAAVGMGAARSDLDLLPLGDPRAWAERLLERVLATAAIGTTPALVELDNTDFQVSRGSLGISL